MAAYDVLFPVRSRVARRFTRQEIERAAQVAFWQHPPDGCTVPEQMLDMTWMDDLLQPGDQILRVTGDVIPPDGPSPDAVAVPDPVADSI